VEIPAGLLAACFFGRDNDRGRRTLSILFVAARAAHGTAQELGLLACILWQAVSAGTFAPARGKPFAGIAALWTLKTLGSVTIPAFAIRPVTVRAVTVHALLAAVLPVETVGPITALMTLLAIAAVAVATPVILLKTAVARTLILIARLVALRTLAPVFALPPVLALAPVLETAGTGIHHTRLVGTGLEALFATAVTFGPEAAFRTVRMAIETATRIARIAALAYLLLAVGKNDAVIVLGMLEIVFCQHRIARGLCIPCERNVFLGDVRRRATQLHIGTIALEASRQRILAFALLIALIASAAASAVLLSLPHGLQSQIVIETSRRSSASAS